MILRLHNLPISLNYNIILVFMLRCISIQIITGIFLVMSQIHGSFFFDDFTFSMLFSFFVLTRPQHRVINYNLFGFCLLIFVSFCGIFIPFFSFFISCLTAIFFCLQPFSFFFNKKEIFYDFIKILIKYSFMEFLYPYYKFFIIHERYKLHLILLYTTILIYVFVSRYYFLNRILTIPIFICLILGLVSIYFRILVSAYIYIYTSILIMEPPFPDDNNSGKSWVTFNFNKYINNQNLPPPNSRSNLFKNLGYTVAFITCGVACMTTYYTYLQYLTSKEQAVYAKEQAIYAKEQAIYAKEQAVQAKEQNIQMQQQNDLAALEQGLITKERFCELQQRYCIKDHAEVLAERMKASKKAGMPGIKDSSEK